MAHFQNANQLALELGNGTTEMLFAHYRELVAPDLAAKYWEIYPAKSTDNKIVAFAA